MRSKIGVRKETDSQMIHDQKSLENHALSSRVSFTFTSVEYVVDHKCHMQNNISSC